MRLLIQKVKRENLDQDTLMRLVKKFGSVPARVVVAQVTNADGSLVIAEVAEMEGGLQFTEEGEVSPLPEPAAKTA